MVMKVKEGAEVVYSDREKIIEPCELEDFTYQIDPYIGCEHGCHYCYTSNRFDPTDEIGIYESLEERLTEELSHLEPQKIYIGMNTDPYQPLEKRYEQTRKVLEILKEYGFSVSILTKSELVVRDIDILKEMPGSSVGISLAFQDDVDRRSFEKNTVPNKDRILAMKNFRKEGIETYALICPVFPYISDVDVLLDKVKDHVDSVWVYPLEIRSVEDKNWRYLGPILEKQIPDKLSEFEDIVFSTDHEYWKELRQHLDEVVIDDVDLKIKI